MSKLNNFHYIAVLLDQLYGVEMEDEDLEEMGLLAWEKIGNKNMRLYRYSVTPDCDNSVTLPCNCDEIEAVTTSYEDWEYVTDKHDLGNQNSAFVENIIEGEKFNKSPFYISGQYIKYQQVGDKLYFNQPYGKINILYKGFEVDDEGLPEISNKEAEAIATYLAYVDKYKEGLKTNNPNLIQIANSLLVTWNKQCDQARVGRLNQNDMNNILNVKDSWGRHTYNKSQKPIQ